MNYITKTIVTSAEALLNSIIDDRANNNGKNVEMLIKAVEHNIMYLVVSGENEQADRLIKILMGYINNTHHYQHNNKRSPTAIICPGTNEVKFKQEGKAAYRLKAYLEGFNKGDVVEINTLSMARALFISRHTVRIYLAQLRKDGLISFSKKKGADSYTITIL